jgi:hypothetical protein
MRIFARYRQALFFVFIAALLPLASCAKANLHQTLKSNFQAPQGGPILLAAYQPWFGQPSHINVGYSSQDPVVLQGQIEKAKDLGIAGFVVNWYGPHKDFEDRSYALMQQEAAKENFQVAILYDEDTSAPGRATDAVLADLQYAYDRYIGPNAAPSRAAYLRYNGRPMIFIFPKDGTTDWNRVRQVTNSWQDPPLLIYKDINPQFAAAFDGFFAWVSPGSRGWSPDGSNWGEQYLDNFYATMSAKYPDKIAVGAAWPGFNDSLASWSQKRKMNSRCGKTLADSLRVFRRYYNGSHPLPFLMIDTWNDYEEGTAIERGMSKC